MGNSVWTNSRVCKNGIMNLTSLLEFIVSTIQCFKSQCYQRLCNSISKILWGFQNQDDYIKMSFNKNKQKPCSRTQKLAHQPCI